MTADGGAVRVEVRLFATVREAAGRRELALDVAADATVGSALAALEADHPALKGTLLADGDPSAVAGGVTVLKNGRNVASLDGAATPLSDGDRVSVTPPVTGG